MVFDLFLGFFTRLDVSISPSQWESSHSDKFTSNIILHILKFKNELNKNEKHLIELNDGNLQWEIYQPYESLIDKYQPG